MTTNREQMIEKARDEISGWEVNGDPIDGEMATSMAESVIDALLPQVTTIEELGALPPKTLLYGTPSGQAEPVLWQPSWQDPQEILETFGPLTVVWQP